MNLSAYMRGLAFGAQYLDANLQEPQFRDPQRKDRMLGLFGANGLKANALERYFDANQTGPGIWKWRHYFDVYQRHLEKFVGKEVHVLEIGVYSGGSLGMWRKYFGPKSRVYGVDLMEECRVYEDTGIEILVGDQGNRHFWSQVRGQIPRIDVVIDDGSHHTEHQIVSIEEMLPHMSPGGVYMCEDVYGLMNGFHDYVAGMCQNLNTWGPPKAGTFDPHLGQVTAAFQRAMGSAHLYPYISVFEKRDQPLSEFSAPRHGSQWQPLFGPKP